MLNTEHNLCEQEAWSTGGVCFSQSVLLLQLTWSTSRRTNKSAVSGLSDPGTTSLRKLPLS